jgi:hypothetical protein
MFSYFALTILSVVFTIKYFLTPVIISVLTKQFYSRLANIIMFGIIEAILFLFLIGAGLGQSAPVFYTLGVAMIVSLSLALFEDIRFYKRLVKKYNTI